MVLYGLLFTLALVASLCLTPPIRAIARRAGVLDVPDGRRKLHPNPVPLLGGVAVFISFYVSLWLVGTQVESPSARSALELATAMFVPSLIILLLGIVDDKRPVSPWIKIAVQLVAGLVVFYQLDIRIDSLADVFPGHSSMPGLLSLPATLLWIVLITNAFNVVDGMDGLATGVAFIALACMFFVSLQINQPAIPFVAAPLAGAVLGFLRYNFNPASIFLGDSGSLFLGFQLAVLSIVGSQKSSTAVSVAAPIFVLALPLVETATSAIRRFVSGKSIMQPDSAHIHHQLMRLGCTPRRAAGILYLSSGAFGLTSLFLANSGSISIGLIAIAFFALTVLAIQRLGYTEFAEINGALRRFVLQRQIIQNGIVCRKLAADLAGASSIESAWSILKTTARQLGFSNIELTLHPRTPDAANLPLPRYEERLQARPGSAQPAETTFAVALTAATAYGQVAFSRSMEAAPLHSELPLLISAVAENLPRVIERQLRKPGSIQQHEKAGSAQDPAYLRVTAWSVEQDPACVPNPIVKPLPDAGFEWNSPHMPCAACGSSRLRRSRSRSVVEQLRKKITARRLFECPSCGWRGWVLQTIATPRPPAAPAHFEAPDLRGLDLALQNVRGPQHH